MTFTLEDLRARLAAKRDEILQWTPEEERLAINEDLRTWNLLTGRWRRRVRLSAVAGQPLYRLPASMVYGMRVVVSDQPLTITSLTEIDLSQPNWKSEVAGSAGVPATPQLWIPVSLNLIGVWPAPALNDTDVIQVDGVSATPVLIESGDTIDLGEDLLAIHLNFVLHLLSFKLGGPTFAATLPAWRAFLQAAADENGVLKANQKFRRWAGLDRRRDLQKAFGEKSQLDPLVAQVGR